MFLVYFIPKILLENKKLTYVNESLDIAEDWGGNCSFTSGLPLFLGWLSFVSTGGIHSPVLLFEDLAFS